MVDREPKPSPLEINGVKLEQTHMGLAVFGIPCDEGGPTTLDVIGGLMIYF